MRTNKMYIKIASLLLVFMVAGCVNDDEVNQERSGSKGKPGLEVVVKDTTPAVVPGAVVTLYGSSADYIAETNPLAEKTADANGEVFFSKAEMGGTPGVYFFSVASGTLRNWSSATSSGYLYLTSGPTRINTTVAPVLQTFIDLTTGSWRITSYEYGGFNAWDPTNGLNPACAADDVFQFLKTGQLRRKEGPLVCVPSPFNADQGPVSVAGSNWSPWVLNATGTAFTTLRDLDPDFETATQTGKNYGVTVVPGVSITINYGGPYIAVMVPN